MSNVPTNASSSLSSISSSSSMSTDEIEQEFRKLELSNNGGKKQASREPSSTGGFHFTNKSEVQEQRRAIWDFVKEVGSSLFEGRDLVSVSLPVYIFEPRSFLERITDLWTHQHIFLTSAAHMTDPVKRMKLVVAFAVSGLHMTCVCKKPFNPILGETFQARFANGALVFCEQCSHHPPVSRFELIGHDNEFTMYGQAGYNASLRGNAIKGCQSGSHSVRFADDTVITFSLPYMWLSGVMWGERVMDYTGAMEFEDRKNGLRCVLGFNPDKKSWWRSLVSKPTTSSDTIRGEIESYEYYAGPAVSKEDRREIEERINSNNTTKHGVLEGSWLTHLDWIGVRKERVWDVRRESGEQAIPIEDPLPSDSRFREDLVYIKKGDLGESQRWKVILEERQRHEAKLRKQFEEKLKLESHNSEETMSRSSSNSICPTDDWSMQ